MTDKNPKLEHFDVVVVGAGQAGLATGYFLARSGLKFAILDAGARVGDVWRRRWDSLKLFTSARFDALPGLPFPAHRHAFPSKDEMADYLEAYARTFELPVFNSMRVERLTRENGRYLLQAGDRVFSAEHVVIAMARYQKPRVPAFASELGADVVQLHSFDYRGPRQLVPGRVLIVGAGNSGAELAMEISRTHQVILAGRDTGQVPFRIDGFWARLCLAWLVLRVVFHRVLTVRTPMGRKMRRKMQGQGGPLIRIKPTDLAAAGVTRVPRITSIHEGSARLADGRVLEAENVIWCTGFDHGFGFFERPVFGPDGEVLHEAGVVTNEPGLYLVGLEFVYAFSSTMIHGVGRDAERIVGTIVTRARAQRAPSSSSASAAA